MIDVALRRRRRHLRVRAAVERAATAATAAVERWSANEALGTASPMRANAPPPVSVSTTTPSRVATPARRNSGSARQPKEPKTISGSTDAKLGGSINPENVYMPLRGLNVEAGDWPDVVPGGLAWPLWQPGPAGRGAMPLTPAQPLLTVAGAVVGVVAGLALQSQEGESAGVALRAVALPGVLWVQTLQVLSVPLAVLSILSATAAIGWPPPPGTPHLARATPSPPPRASAPPPPSRSPPPPPSPPRAPRSAPPTLPRPTRRRRRWRRTPRPPPTPPTAPRPPTPRAGSSR